MDVREGEVVHASVVRSGFESSQYVSGALLRFYVDCGFVDSGRQVFDEMIEPGLVVWTAMIRAYTCVNLPGEVELFGKMREGELVADSVALAIVVSACSQLGDIGVAKAIHGYISKSGIEVDEVVNGRLVSMYGDCGSLDLAHQIFMVGPPFEPILSRNWRRYCTEEEHLERH